MTKVRDIALIIAAAVLVFFAGSNIDLSSGLEENTLYLAVLDALQGDQPGDAGTGTDAPLVSSTVDDDDDDSGDDSGDATELPIEVSLEPNTTIAYPSGTMVDFTLTITNAAENKVTLTKIEDDQFGFIGIDEGKCKVLEDEPDLVQEIDGNGEFTCEYEGIVKAALGETFTNTISVTTQDEKVATASVNTNISKSIVGIFPGNQITITGKNSWPFIKKNVISQSVELIVRDQNTDESTIFVWGPVYSPNSGKSVGISLGGENEFVFEIKTPSDSPKVNSDPLRVNLDLADKEKFLSPGEYTTEIYINKTAESEAGKVSVNVLIGFHWVWIGIATAFGVGITRLLFWWKDEKRHKVNWADLRANWMDLLSEDFGWISKIPDASKSLILHQIRKDLGAKVEDLLNWLDSLAKGGVSIGQIKDILPNLQSLEEYVIKYLGRSLSEPDSAGANITACLEKIGTSAGEKLVGELISEAVSTSKVKLNNLKELQLLDKDFSAMLEKAKEELKKIKEQPDSNVPNDLKTKLEKIELLAVPIEVINKAKESFGKQELQNKLSKVDSLKNPEEILSLIKLIKPIFEGFEDKVVKVVSSGEIIGWVTALDSINSIHVQTFKDQVKEIFEGLNSLSGVYVNKFALALKAAEFPGEKLEVLISKIKAGEEAGGLQGIKGEIPSLCGEDINPDYLMDKMFSPILKDFKEADQGYNTTDTADLEAHWKKSQLKYFANARIIRSARDLEDLIGFFSIDKRHIRRAYENLLANKGLEVEISTQRAIERAIMPPSKKDKKAAVKAVEKAVKSDKDRKIGKKHELTFFSFMLDCGNTFDANKKEGETLDVYLKSEMSDLVTEYSTSKKEDEKKEILDFIYEMESINQLNKEIKEKLKEPTDREDGSGNELWINLFVDPLRSKKPSGTDRTFDDEVSARATVIKLSVTDKTKLADAIKAREDAENRKPACQKCVLVIFFTALTIIVATALVIYGNKLFGNLNTWGTPFDWLTAFVVGVLAERLEEPTTDLIDNIAKAIKDLVKGDDSGDGGESGETGAASSSAAGESSAEE